MDKVYTLTIVFMASKAVAIVHGEGGGGGENVHCILYLWILIHPYHTPGSTPGFIHLLP